MEINLIKNWDLTEIVFEPRNKEYGAYQLRRKYSRIMTTAMIAAIGLFLLFGGFPVIANKFNLFPKPPKEEMIVTTVELVDPPPLDENKPEPPPVEPPPPVKETVKFVAPDVKKDEDVKEQEEEVVQIIDSLKETNAQISTSNQEGDENAEPEVGIIEGRGKEVEDVVETKIVEEPKVFTVVEQMPQFPGGDAALYAFLSKNIKYPTRAKEDGIESKVFVKFVVMEDGSIDEVTAIRGGEEGGLREEAVRVIKSLPKFSPGKQQGKAVRVYYSVPVNFKLE